MLRSITLSAVVLAVTACGSNQTKTTPHDEVNVAVKEYQLRKCDAPVASILIGSFECQSNQCSREGEARPSGIMALAAMSGAAVPGSLGELGKGMSAMVTSALKETGCFEIQDRDSLQQLQQEMALVNKELKPEATDYIISAVISDASLITTQRRIGGGWIPVVGSIKRTTQKASLQLELKIIDVNNAKVIAAQSFTGDSESTKTSTRWSGYNNGILWGGMTSIKGTPMEGVIQEVLTETLAYTTDTIAPANTAQASNQTNL